MFLICSMAPNICMLLGVVLLVVCGVNSSKFISYFISFNSNFLHSNSFDPVDLRSHVQSKSLHIHNLIYHSSMIIFSIYIYTCLVKNIHCHFNWAD